MLNFLYTLFFLPLVLIRILYKAVRNPKYLVRVSERFGIYNDHSQLKPKNTSVDIWLHTVSVGEFLATKPLILELLKIKPDYKILITCTTLTGSELISKFIEQNKVFNLYHVYYPYDNTIICNRFLNTFKPKLAVFLETEIWPKMFTQIKQHDIKLFIINARLSEKSFNNYFRFQKFIKPIINKVDLIVSQGNLDQTRFLKLGIASDKIITYGNIKYNIKLPDDLDSKSNEYKQILNIKNNLVLIAASTHNGEDEIIINIYLKLKKVYPDLLLVIVPRHPERFSKVYNLCLNTGLNTKKFSAISFDLKTTKSNNLDNVICPDIFVLDTIGQLLYFYNLADLAFIGGSLIPIGGHNPLEPAALKIPAIMGPNYYNFSQIVDNLKEANGIIICENNNALEASLLKLLGNQNLRRDLADNAFKIIEQNKNILEKYVTLLIEN